MGECNLQLISVFVLGYDKHGNYSFLKVKKHSSNGDMWLGCLSTSVEPGEVRGVTEYAKDFLRLITGLSVLDSEIRVTQRTFSESGLKTFSLSAHVNEHEVVLAPPYTEYKWENIDSYLDSLEAYNPVSSKTLDIISVNGADIMLPEAGDEVKDKQYGRGIINSVFADDDGRHFCAINFEHGQEIFEITSEYMWTTKKYFLRNFLD